MSLSLAVDNVTDAEEVYCQCRAAGMTKTASAMKAFNTQYPRQMGYEAEQRQRVVDRIRELKEERAEVSGLDVQEQVRRYTELYQLLRAEGKYTQAAAILARLDSIGGFDAPTKSVTLSGKLGETVRDTTGDLKRDVDKFSKILLPHTMSVEAPASELVIDTAFEDIPRE